MISGIFWSTENMSCKHANLVNGHKDEYRIQLKAISKNNHYDLITQWCMMVIKYWANKTPSTNSVSRSTLYHCIKMYYRDFRLMLQLICFLLVHNVHLGKCLFSILKFFTMFRFALNSEINVINFLHASLLWEPPNTL